MHLLAIDQGTTSTRAIAFDAAGVAHHTAQVELTRHHPQPGWVEHDPEEIWRGVVATCREAIAAAGGAVAAIGITNQRETTVLWERAGGRPVHNAIVWQDRRTAPLCRRWRDDGLDALVAARTGLVIDPYFSASKIRWLLDSVPGLAARARAGEIAFGTIDSFLLWRLSGGRVHATDVTNASRTMLFDLDRLAWDDELLGAFGIPRAILPEVRDTGADYGDTEPALFGRPIPIAGIAGDQQAALIGQACFRPGMVKSTYGTGAFALVHTGAAAPRSQHRLVTTLAYRLAGETAYALEGSIFVAGAAVQWLRDRLGLIAAAAECDALAAAADPQQRVYLVPGFAGLGAPYWAPEARGAVVGLTAECGGAELARAVLEAVGYQTRDLMQAMQADSGLAIGTLRVDGGMAASERAMQFLADILPARVERPASLETTAWGAAYVAGLVRGLCPSPAEMTARWQAARHFAPAMGAAEREERYAGWRRAVAAVLAASGR
jgi:glycerol kinase